MTAWMYTLTATAVVGGALVHRQMRHHSIDVARALNDPARLAALDALDVVGRPPIAELDELAQSAAGQLRAPSAIISLLGADCQHFPGVSGLGGGHAATTRSGLSYDYSFCKYVIATERALEVGDALRHPLTRNSPSATERGVRSYLGVPMRTRNGVLVGTVCVFDTFTRKWTADDHAKLARIAQLAMRTMERQVAERRALEETARDEHVESDDHGVA